MMRVPGLRVWKPSLPGRVVGSTVVVVAPAEAAGAGAVVVVVVGAGLADEHATTIVMRTPKTIDVGAALKV
jgi:hypothetical protein